MTIRSVSVGGLMAVGLAGCSSGTSEDTQAVLAWNRTVWTDQHGRQVMHRGMNLNNAAKSNPDHLHGMTDDELQLLVDHGVSLVRYLVFWNALEPEQGALDQVYIDSVVEDIGRVTGLGIDVVVDMHQDVYGEGFGHAGMPTWTCAESYYETYDPAPGAWWSGYITEEVQACFDGFWADEDLQDAYGDAFGELAASIVAADDGGVVAFEVMNEPFWGTLENTEFETEILPAFYISVASKLPSDRWVVVEPSVRNNLVGETELVLPNDYPWILGPHFYPTYAEMASGWDGTFRWEAEWLEDLVDAAAERELPFFLGEFGIFSNEGNEHEYVQQVMETIGKMDGSGAYWSFDRNSSWGPVTASGEAGPGLLGLLICLAQLGADARQCSSGVTC